MSAHLPRIEVIAIRELAAHFHASYQDLTDMFQRAVADIEAGKHSKGLLRRGGSKKEMLALYQGRAEMAKQALERLANLLDAFDELLK